MDTQLSLFLQSAAIGLSIAAPVGQIGLLAIQRTLQYGVPAGIATGLGAAVADAIYGAVGAFGISALIAFLVEQRTLLAGAGSALLLAMAWRIARQPPAERRGDAGERAPLGRLFAGTFALTLANPTTILSFVAVFGALAGPRAVASPWVMVAGVAAGSAAWWFVLAGVVGRLRSRFDARWQRRVNRASAALLAGFALWQLAALARG
ncbi:MAG: LysE family transporter [Comamonadaceae bacterium]|nr:LysE family transporter [Comamonadaceae bacterium]